MKIDSILLFSLIAPIVMTYGLGVGDTPYWLFGLIFLGLLLYVALDYLPVQEKRYFQIKYVLLWLLIIAVVGAVFLSAIIVRHTIHPIYRIHDMPLQQEIAIRFLLDGKNPYATNYFGTFLEEWHYSETEVNPALYHFVLPPFYIVFALPFYFLSNMFLGYFDAREPILFLLLVSLVLIGKLVKERSLRLTSTILFAFNPAMFAYTLEGRSDMFMYGFLMAGLYLLHKRKLFLAGIPIGLAFAVKQSVWPLFPFYAAFLYFHKRNVSETAKNLSAFVISFALPVIPFFLWDPKAFLDSTVFYLSGTTENSYPVSGYGLGMLLSQLGFIKDLHAYYPFHIWQLVFGFPLLIVLIAFLRRSPTVGRLILVYGIFLFVFWYLSRYFNNSHVGYLSMVFMTAYFWPQDEKS